MINNFLILEIENNRILNFWAVSDNLLKGAALNAVQIARYIVDND